MMNHKLMNAGKIVFLGSLLMTSVGLSPKHLMLASNQNDEFITLSSTDTKRVRAKIDGKTFDVELSKPKVTAFTEAGEKDTQEKFEHETEITYKQILEGTEACPGDCQVAAGTVVMKSVTSSSTNDLNEQIAQIKATIGKQLGASKAQADAKGKKEREEANKEDYKACKKVDPKLKKLHDDSEAVARMACYVAAADAADRKGNLADSAAWAELVSIISEAATSKESGQRSLLSTLENWSKGRDLQITADLTAAGTKSTFRNALKSSIEANRQYARMDAEMDRVNRGILSLGTSYDSAQREVLVAKRREDQSFNSPMCMYNQFSCWSNWNRANQDSRIATDKLADIRERAFLTESTLLNLSPTRLSAFDGGIYGDSLFAPQAITEYVQDYDGSLKALVRVTGSTDLLNLARQDYGQVPGRGGYEMGNPQNNNPGLRGSDYGLRTQLATSNFAGRTLRGGPIAATATTTGAGGRTLLPQTTAFSTLQAYSSPQTYTVPQTGVDLLGQRSYYGSSLYQQGGVQAPSTLMYAPIGGQPLQRMTVL